MRLASMSMPLYVCTDSVNLLMNLMGRWMQ